MFRPQELDELINSRFAERLAQNINKVKMSAESNPADRPHSSTAGSSAGTTTTTGTTTTAGTTTATVAPPQDVMAPSTASSPDGSPVKMVADNTELSHVVTTASTEVVTSQPIGVVSIEVGCYHWLNNMSQRIRSLCFHTGTRF